MASVARQGLGKALRFSWRRTLGCIPSAPLLNPNCSSSWVAGVTGDQRCPLAGLGSGVTSASDPLGCGSSGFNSHPSKRMEVIFVPFKRDEGEGRKAQPANAGISGAFSLGGGFQGSEPFEKHSAKKTRPNQKKPSRKQGKTKPPRFCKGLLVRGAGAVLCPGWVFGRAWMGAVAPLWC